MDDKNFVNPSEISASEMEISKSNTIKYLQYLSILFSIVFSVSGIYYFLHNSPQKKSTQTPMTFTQDIPNTIYSGWIEMGNYIWSKEIGYKLNYWEATQFCHNLPTGTFRIPNQELVDMTHVDNTGKQFENRVFTGNAWFWTEMTNTDILFTYNPSTNTLQNSSPLENNEDWIDKNVRCITEKKNIYPNYVENFPECDDKNIVLSNWQVWSACNLWASKRWNQISSIQNCQISLTDCNKNLNWKWNYYQFWSYHWDVFISEYENINKDWKLDGAFDSRLLGFEWWIKTWQTKESNQWPCPYGWHIPQIREWLDAYRAAWSSMQQLQSALYLPETWYRDGKYGNYKTVENNWKIPSIYWSSSSDLSGNIILPDFQNTSRDMYIATKSEPIWYNAYAIRCIKN